MRWHKRVHNPRVVVIGGGTGSYTLLRYLKRYTSSITALVTMFDSGGSTGQLRDEYGVLPPGDIRQCLVALSNEPQVRDVFNYRFGKGSVEGHSFGNLFLTAVEKTTDDFGEAVKLAGKILNITGQVLPITLDKAQLVMRDGDMEFVGEHVIERVRFESKRRPELSLRPVARINPEAKAAIEAADLVVIAPGSLYESVISGIIVEGVAEALGRTRAKVAQVVNLATKPGQTDGWSVCDFVDEVERFMGKGIVDYVLYNTGMPTQEMLAQYAREGEFPVRYDRAAFKGRPYRAIGVDLLQVYDKPRDPHDKLALERTLIRHNSEAVWRALLRLL